MGNLPLTTVESTFSRHLAHTHVFILRIPCTTHLLVLRLLAF